MFLAVSLTIDLNHFITNKLVVSVSKDQAYLVLLI
jgi:hypothetical protein